MKKILRIRIVKRSRIRRLKLAEWYVIIIVGKNVLTSLTQRQEAPGRNATPTGGFLRIFGYARPGLVAHD